MLWAHACHKAPRGFTWDPKCWFFDTLRHVFTIVSLCSNAYFMSSSDSKQWLLSILLCLTSSSWSFDFLDISWQARWTTACSFGVLEFPTFISWSKPHCRCSRWIVMWISLREINFFIMLECSRPWDVDRFSGHWVLRGGGRQTLHASHEGGNPTVESFLRASWRAS